MTKQRPPHNKMKTSFVHMPWYTAQLKNKIKAGRSTTHTGTQTQFTRLKKDKQSLSCQQCTGDPPLKFAAPPTTAISRAV